MHGIPVLLAYFGPDTMLPVTSVVATVAGIFLMMGRTGWRLIFRLKDFGVGPVDHTNLRGHHLARRPHPKRCQEPLLKVPDTFLSPGTD